MEICEKRLNFALALVILLGKGAIELKKCGALSVFLERFQEILEDLDAFEMDETLEELNAQLEDALFLLESVDADAEGAGEERSGAIEEIGGLLEEYRALSTRRPELCQKVLELEMAVQMAGRNME